jgi:helix-turn-helix protein
MHEPELPPLKTYAPGQKLTINEKEELGKDLRAHYETGASLRGLARKTGRSVSSVRDLQIDSGAGLRGRGKHRNQDQDQDHT